MNDPSLRAERRPSRSYTAAVILASLLIPIPVLTSQVVELITDSTNPSGLDDLSAGLAYLGVILAVSLIALAATLIGFLVAVVVEFKRTRSFGSIALPVTIALIQLVIGVAAIILTQAINYIDG